MIWPVCIGDVKIYGEITETEDSERSDSPEVGFEGMFFAWGTVLWTSS
jgi:hypothetical protein